MPTIFSPWIILGLVLVLGLSNGATAYYEHGVGYNKRVAEESDAKDAVFKKILDDSADRLKAQGADIVAAWAEKSKTLDNIGERLSKIRINTNVPITELAAMVRAGGCVLDTPDKRLRADAFRNPSGLGLPGSPATAMPVALPGQGTNSAAPPGR